MDIQIPEYIQNMTPSEIDAEIAILNEKLDDARCGNRKKRLKPNPYVVPELVQERELYYIWKHRR